MLSAHSEVSTTKAPAAPIPVKLIIAGGFGVGKTTMVSAISEIPPLTTEAAMTSVAAEIDDSSPVPTKTTTTVAMDFGRITVDSALRLYLFGTPGQARFGFMWNELNEGALGAVVLVDSRRIEDSFPALDYFESRDTPFIVAVNQFSGRLVHDLESVRGALNVETEIPVVATDARSKDAVKSTVLVLLDVVLKKAIAAQEQ